MSDIRHVLESMLSSIRVGPDSVGEDKQEWAYRPGCLEHGRGIPQRLAEVLRGNLGPSEARDKIREHGAPGVMLVLAGKTGTGKSVAAAEAIAKARAPAQLKYRPRFVAVADYVRACQGDTERGIGQWTEHEIQCCNTLALDDLGTEWASASDFSSHVIRELLERRERERNTTIMTTNLSRQDFANRYGTRIVSRIAGAGKWIQISGDDMRRPKN